MLYAEQIRAARAMLGWDQAELARKAGVGTGTLRRLEAQQGVVRAHVATIMRLQNALEGAGICFQPTIPGARVWVGIDG